MAAIGLGALVLLHNGIFREVFTTVTIAWLDPAIQSLVALEATIRLRAYCYAHALGMSITSL